MLVPNPNGLYPARSAERVKRKVESQKTHPSVSDERVTKKHRILDCIASTKEGQYCHHQRIEILEGENIMLNQSDQRRSRKKDPNDHKRKSPSVTSHLPPACEVSRRNFESTN